MNRIHVSKYSKLATMDGSPLVNNKAAQEDVDVNYGSNAAPQALDVSPRKAMQDYGSNTNLYDPNHTWSVCEYIILFFAWLLMIIPIFWFSIFRSVRDYERAVIFRLGKISGGAKGPGIFMVNPLTDTIRVIDLRIVTYNLPPQAMMTKDAVTVTVDAISFMKVLDPIRAVLEVDDFKNAFNSFAATTLRSVIGQYDMEMLLSNRDEINAKAQAVIEAETNAR